MENKQTHTTVTDTRIKSPKFWLLFSAIAILISSLAIVVSLIIGAYHAKYFLFPVLLMLTDVAFLLVVIFSNFRFHYTLRYFTYYLAVSVILTVAAVVLDGGANGTRLFTHAAIYSFLILHLIAVLAVFIGYVHASHYIKKGGRARLAAACCGVLLVVGTALYSYSVFICGWFGQGTVGVERTLEYAWNEITDSYTVTDVASQRGDTVIIPTTFNGKPVNGVDCSFATSPLIRQIYFESETISLSDLTNWSALLSSAGDRTVYTKLSADNALVLRNEMFDEAAFQQDATMLAIANTVVPYSLPEGKIYVSFTYDLEDLFVVHGAYAPVWVGEPGEQLSEDYLSHLSYVQYTYDASVPQNKIWAYTHLQKHICTGVSADTFGGFGSTVTQSIDNVKFEFEPLSQIHIMSDNDAVYEMPDSLKYFDAENKVSHILLSTEITDWLASYNMRNGFDLHWCYETAAGKLPVDNPLALSLDGIRLYPEWQMKAPAVSAATASYTVVYGEAAQFTVSTAPANESFSLSYEWSYQGTAKAQTKDFDILSTRPEDAGSYLLTVTSSNPAITSLSATTAYEVTLAIAKRPIKLDWTLPSDLVYSATNKTVSVSANPDISTAFGVINGDTITFDTNQYLVKDAGAYSFTPKLTEDCADRYRIAQNASTTVTITPAPLNIVWGNANLTYNAQQQLPTASVTGLGADGNIPLTVSGAMRNVGSGVAVAQTTNRNYTLSNHSFPFTIAPYELDVTWDISTFTYDGKQHKPTAMAMGLGEDGALSFATNGEQTNVGENYTVTVIGTDSTGNYKVSASTASTQFTIEQRTLTVSFALALQRVLIYDGRAWEWNATLSNTVTGESPSVTLLYYSNSTNISVPINTGSYRVEAILDGTNPINGNYKLSTETTKEFTVEKRTVAAIWSNTSLTFNGDPQAPTASYTDVTGASIALVVSGATIEEGSYTATTSLNSANYTLTNTSTPFVIQALDVKISWSTHAFTYDGSQHLPTATVTTTDGSPVILLSPSVQLTAGDGISAGKQTVAAVLNHNFNIVQDETLTYTIEKRTLTVSFALASQRDLIFDGQKWEWTVSLSGMIAGETPSATLVYYNAGNTQIAIPTDAGTYKVEAILESSNSVNANYQIVVGETKNFTVERKTVAVAWNNTTFIFNGEAQAPTATFTDVTGASLSLSVSGAATNKGTYTATAKLNDTNYTLTNNTVSFTIQALNVKISWSVPTFTYEGRKLLPSATVTTVNGEHVTLLSPSVQLTVGNGIDAGSHTVAAVLDANFNIVEGATITYTIGKRTLTLSFALASQRALVFDGHNWEWTVSLSNMVAGEAPSATLLYFNAESAKIGIPTNAGTYSLEAILDPNNPANANYLLAGTTTKQFTVEKATVAVNWSNTVLTFNGSAQKPLGSITNVNGHNVPLTVSVSGTAVSKGEYTATASLDDANYTLTNTSTTFNIIALDVKISWSSLSFTYDGHRQLPTATVTTLSGSPVTLLSPDIQLTMGDGIAIGTHTVTALLNENFNIIEGSTATYTIQEAQIDG